MTNVTLKMEYTFVAHNWRLMTLIGFVTAEERLVQKWVEMVITHSEKIKDV